MFISVTFRILSFRTLPFIPQKNPHQIFRKLPVDNFPHSAICIPQNTPSPDTPMHLLAYTAGLHTQLNELLFSTEKNET